MRIKDLGKEDRPREKLLRSGAVALTNSELLALILRSGTMGCNVVELAQQVLQFCNGRLSRLCGMDVTELGEIQGIGQGKAVVILAALELGRRLLEEEGGRKEDRFLTPEKVFHCMSPLLKFLTYEQAWVLYLNRSAQILDKVRLSSGTEGETLIDCRQIVRDALQRKASAVILVHNHPSGNPEPGKQDILTTEHLRKALRAMDLLLLDHVIISDGAYFSFADQQTRYL